MTVFQNVLITLLAWNAVGFVLTIWVIQYCFSRYIHELRKIRKEILSINNFLLGCQWDALREWKLNQGEISGSLESVRRMQESKKQTIGPAGSNYELSISYADNVPVRRVLTISLTPLGWSEFEQLPYFRDLMEFLEHLKIRNSLT